MIRCVASPLRSPLAVARGLAGRRRRPRECPRSVAPVRPDGCVPITDRAVARGARHALEGGRRARRQRLGPFYLRAHGPPGSCSTFCGYLDSRSGDRRA